MSHEPPRQLPPTAPLVLRGSRLVLTSLDSPSVLKCLKMSPSTIGHTFTYR